MADQTDSSQGDSQPNAAPPAAPGSSGLPQNVAAGLAVLFSIIGGIVFLVIEKKNAYVRFYAMQSIVLGVVVLVLDLVIAVLVKIPFLGVIFGLLSILFSLGCLALFIITLIKAFTGVEWEIPYIGKQARKFLKTTAI
jgi:uncharacterized membrane protein